MPTRLKVTTKFFLHCTFLLLPIFSLNFMGRRPSVSMMMATAQKVMCLDEHIDFENGGWTPHPHTIDYEMAADETELPDILCDKCGLGGKDIFWFEGGQNSNQWFITGKFEHITLDTVVYMYVKYYGHIHSNSRIYAYPAQVESGDLDLFSKLKNTTDYQWKEDVVLLNMRRGMMSAIGVKTLGLKEEEYFLLDKIIIMEVPLNGTEMEAPLPSAFENKCHPAFSSPQESHHGNATIAQNSRPNCRSTEKDEEAPPISPNQRPTFPSDTYDCIDSMEKFNATDWRIKPDYSFTYAESSDDLPDPLRGRITGSSIFYAQGPINADDAPPFLQFTDFSGKLPMFLYLKYYIHDGDGGSRSGSTGSEKGVMVTPTALEWTRPHFLDVNHDFTWMEIMVEIDGVKGADLGVEIGVLDFGPGDFFLIDDIVLTQGFPITEMWEIKGLCEPTTIPDPESSTTSTTDSSTWSTESTTVTSTTGDTTLTTLSSSTDQNSESTSSTSTPSPTGSKGETGQLDVSTVILIFFAVSAILFLFQWGLRKMVVREPDSTGLSEEEDEEREQKRSIRSLSSADVSDFQNGRDYHDPSDVNASIYSLPYEKELEIPRDKLELNEMSPIGVGKFGIVLPGLLTRAVGSPEKVAVKTVRADVTVDTFKSLLAEIKIMSYLCRHRKHENIAFLIGACTTNIKKLQVLAVVEFCANGDLLNFLRKQGFVKFPAPTSSKNYIQLAKPQNFLTPDLLRFCLGIANGMMYLTEMNVVHGDLAARNILLTDKMEVKISDFGLSRQLLNYPIYHKRQQATLYLPLMWMPIESIKNRHFSVKSDVWSFGVVLWEIWSLGDEPDAYFGSSFLTELEDGKRLPEPNLAEETSSSLFEMMQDCWQEDPSARPSFEQLHAQLQDIMSEVAPGDQSGNYERMESVDIVLITNDYASQDETCQQLLRPRRSISSASSASTYL